MAGMDTTGTGLLQGIDADHLPALIELLALPLFVWLFFKLMHALRGLGVHWAERWSSAYAASSLLARATALLLAATGTIHLALVPAHLHEQPVTAMFFLSDGLLLIALSVALFAWRRARAMAAALLVLSILAYLPYLLAGKEEPDQVGIATKLIELAALGLALLPPAGSLGVRRALRWSLATGTVVALTLVSGSVIWAASLSPRLAARARAADDPVGAAHREMPGMVMQTVPDRPPTPEERAAAEQLLAETRAEIAKYQDISAAIAAGYRASTSPRAPTVHYMNWTSMKEERQDGRALDPKRPASLVYANTDRGPVLLGAMYVMPRPGEPGPDVGGPLTDWHVHTNLCFAPKAAAIVGLTSPFGTCAAGSLNVSTAAMIHVWIVDNPGGPFGNLDPAFLQRLRTT